MALVEAARKVRAITGQPFAHGQTGVRLHPPGRTDKIFRRSLKGR
jgi:hypothetical protein